MKMIIEIEMDNAAFDDPEEFKRILLTVTGQDGQKLRDVNGNHVGYVQVTA